MWLLLLALLAMSGARNTPSSPKQPPPSQGGDKVTRKQLLYAKLRSLPQITEPQRLFVMLVAYGETGGGWKSTAHNNTASEVEASRNAWRNNPQLAAKLEALGHGGIDAWAIGSGGYGGRLVPYFGDDMLDAGMPEHATPHGVFDPDLSIVSTILTAWKLQQYDGWNGTVGSLRAGFYGPGYMAHPPADRILKYKRHAAEVNLPGTFVDSTLGRFPGPAVSRSILATLREGGAVA